MSKTRHYLNLSMAAAIFAGALLCSCASGRPVPLSEEIRQAKGLTVGVALGRICPPEMQIEGPPADGIGPRLTDSVTFGRRNGEYRGRRHPVLLSDKRKLEAYLRTAQAGVFREIQECLADELSAGAWNAVPLKTQVRESDLPRFQGPEDGYEDRDYRGIAPGAGLDALMVIDCRWLGVYCHYTGYLHQDFTDASARLQGRMIDLKTNRILWQSPEVRVRNPIPCRCNEPEDFPCIGAAVRSAAYEAASALMKDLFQGGP